MLVTAKSILLLAIVVCSVAAFPPKVIGPGLGPEYTSDGQLNFPEHYREWVYLTSGFDMSYNPALPQSLRLAVHP
jgi:hypothetical protein